MTSNRATGWLSSLWKDRDRYRILAGQAHDLSRGSVRWSSEELGVPGAYLQDVVAAHTRPTRDLLLVLCSQYWELDLAETDEILRAGGYAPLLRLR